MTQLSNEVLLELSRSLLAAPDSSTRAALLALAIQDSLQDSACVLYRYRAEEEDSAWTVVAIAGDISQSGAELGDTLIGPLLSDVGEPLLYEASAIQREQYAHLQVNRTVASLAYVPLVYQENLIGAIEILSFAHILTEDDFAAILPITELAPSAMLAAEQSEEQRQGLFNSVLRLTQLYDLEKSLNATLDLEELIALVPEKASAMLECQALHLWLFDGGDLRLSGSSGVDPTVHVGLVQAAGAGYVADMAEEGEPLRIIDPADERLAMRNGALDPENETLVENALLVPLLQDGAEVGVLEAVNKIGRPFDEDDEFFLVSMAETVSSALHNASLMFAERKLEILQALVRVSAEITSTLRLDRLLQIIVNSPQNVLPYERCSVALEHRGRLQLRAVSGMSSIPIGDVQVERLHVLLRWLSTQTGVMHLRAQQESDSDSQNKKAETELPAAVAAHFEAAGYGGLFALPLVDDQGRVGLLLYESSDPNFLEQAHIEMIRVLAAQTTVAIRNALLYREVPLITFLEPIMQRKHALLRTTGRRRASYAAIAAAIALFLIFCPLPMRVSGDATVAPQHLVTIAAPVEGNVAAVSAHEGQHVAAGDVLGAMTDWQWQTELASSQARYQQALMEMESDLSHGSAQAGADRARAEYLSTEVSRAQNRLVNSRLRSPIAGIVVTPNLQNVAGQHLDAGAAFAQVLDLSSAVVNIAVPQQDESLIKPGQKAALKLDSYPQRSWHGTVAIVSPQAQVGEAERSFVARLPLPNDDATLRSGMSGRAKIFVGWRPAGYVLLRRPALWMWQTLWDWIGW